MIKTRKVLSNTKQLAYVKWLESKAVFPKALYNLIVHFFLILS